MHRPSHRVSSLTVLGFLLALPGAAPAQATEGIAPLIQEGEERLEQAQQAQQSVNAIQDETQKLVEQYRERLQNVDDLKLYNGLLARKLDNQQQEMAKLERSINNAAQIERRILPLLDRMITTLGEFIKLDLPFLMEERTNRVAGLRKMLERSDVSIAEKLRRVFEAYQIESEYGRSIEAYKAKLAVDGKTFDAEILRVGRIALVYRGLGSQRAGYWDREAGRWRADAGTAFRRHVEQGLKVARREVAPELLTVPVLIGRQGG